MLRAARALAIAFAVTLSAAPVGAADTNLTISIPSIDMGDAPYFVAQQKGYFAAEGLHVDFTFAGGGIATPALIAGSIQASASGSAALSARQGFPDVCARPVTSTAGQAALVADVFSKWMVGAPATAAKDASVLFENADNPGSTQVRAILRHLPLAGLAS